MNNEEFTLLVVDDSDENRDADATANSHGSGESSGEKRDRSAG